jgi:hypothetical protein
MSHAGDLRSKTIYAVDMDRNMTTTIVNTGLTYPSDITVDSGRG